MFLIFIKKCFGLNVSLLSIFSYSGLVRNLFLVVLNSSHNGLLNYGSFMHFKSTSMIFIDRFVKHMSCYNGNYNFEALEIQCNGNVFFAFCRAHSVQFSRCQFYKLFIGIWCMYLQLTISFTFSLCYFSTNHLIFF